MIGKKLSYFETMFCWSPKLEKVVTLIGPQIALSEVAESRPDVESYTFPGPTISQRGDAKEVHQVRMSVTFRNGVTGGIDYLSSLQIANGYREWISETARKLDLHLEMVTQQDLRDRAKHYESWRQLVRHLHPTHKPAQWPLSEELRAIDLPRERVSINELRRLTKTQGQDILVAVAFLVYSGAFCFDTERGTYDLGSKVWGAKP